jgi:medium-chain acyl-[acyl-carrier-protein] hydrolase
LVFLFPCFPSAAKIINIKISENINTLSNYKKNMLDASQISPWFLFSKTNSQAKVRLFCLHHAGVGAFLFGQWKKYLPPEIEIYAVQLPGRENRLGESPFTRIDQLVKTLTPIMIPYLDKPFAFFGHSLGALLSFEITRELRRQNAPTPIHLFVSSRIAPQLSIKINSLIHELPETAFLQEICRRYDGIPEMVLQNTELMQIFLPALRADFAMLETYIYANEEPLNCPISAFGGREDREVSEQAIAAWQHQTSSYFKMQMFDGGHFFFRSDIAPILSIITQTLME